jgi:hypothetical protein
MRIFYLVWNDMYVFLGVGCLMIRLSNLEMVFF